MKTSEDVAGWLSQSPLFGELDPEGIDRLATIAVAVEYPPGTAIISEGEQGEAFYILHSGQLSVGAADFGDEQKTVATLEPGSIFGEVSALTGEPRTATITSMDACRAFKFEMVAVFSILKDYPEVLSTLKRLAVARTEDLLNKMGGF